MNSVFSFLKLIISIWTVKKIFHYLDLKLFILHFLVLYFNGIFSLKAKTLCPPVLCGKDFIAYEWFYIRLRLLKIVNKSSILSYFYI